MMNKNSKLRNSSRWNLNAVLSWILIVTIALPSFASEALADLVCREFLREPKPRKEVYEQSPILNTKNLMERAKNAYAGQPGEFEKFQRYYWSNFFFGRDELIQGAFDATVSSKPRGAHRPIYMYNRGFYPFDAHLVARNYIDGFTIQQIGPGHFMGANKAILHEDSLNSAQKEFLAQSGWQAPFHSEGTNVAWIGRVRPVPSGISGGQFPAIYNAHGVKIREPFGFAEIDAAKAAGRPTPLERINPLLDRNHLSSASNPSTFIETTPLYRYDQAIYGTVETADGKFIARSRDGSLRPGEKIVDVNFDLAEHFRTDPAAIKIREKLEQLDNRLDPSVRQQYYMSANDQVAKEIFQLREEFNTAVLDGLWKKVTKVVDSSADVNTKIDAVADFYRDYMTLHPFVNGNGREGKLMTDRLCTEIGFYPPIWHNFGQDMVLTREQVRAELRDALVLSEKFHRMMAAFVDNGVPLHSSVLPFYTEAELKKAGFSVDRNIPYNPADPKPFFVPEHFVTWLNHVDLPNPPKSVMEALQKFHEHMVKVTYPDGKAVEPPSDTFLKLWGVPAKSQKEWNDRLVAHYGGYYGPNGQLHYIPAYHGLGSVPPPNDDFDVLRHFTETASLNSGMSVSGTEMAKEAAASLRSKLLNQLDEFGQLVIDYTGARPGWNKIPFLSTASPLDVNKAGEIDTAKGVSMSFAGGQQMGDGLEKIQGFAFLEMARPTFGVDAASEAPNVPKGRFGKSEREFSILGGGDSNFNTFFRYDRIKPLVANDGTVFPGIRRYTETVRVVNKDNSYQDIPKSQLYHDWIESQVAQVPAAQQAAKRQELIALVEKPTIGVTESLAAAHRSNQYAIEWSVVGRRLNYNTVEIRRFGGVGFDVPKNFESLTPDKPAFGPEISRTYYRQNPDGSYHQVAEAEVHGSKSSLASAVTPMPSEEAIHLPPNVVRAREGVERDRMHALAGVRQAFLASPTAENWKRFRAAWDKYDSALSSSDLAHRIAPSSSTDEKVRLLSALQQEVEHLTVEKEAVQQQLREAKAGMAPKAEVERLSAELSGLLTERAATHARLMEAELALPKNRAGNPVAALSAEAERSFRLHRTYFPAQFQSAEDVRRLPADSPWKRALFGPEGFVSQDRAVAQYRVEGARAGAFRSLKEVVASGDSKRATALMAGLDAMWAQKKMATASEVEGFLRSKGWKDAEIKSCRSAGPCASTAEISAQRAQRQKQLSANAPVANEVIASRYEGVSGSWAHGVQPDSRTSQAIEDQLKGKLAKILEEEDALRAQRATISGNPNLSRDAKQFAHSRLDQASDAIRKAEEILNGQLEDLAKGRSEVDRLLALERKGNAPGSLVDPASGRVIHSSSVAEGLDLKAAVSGAGPAKSVKEVTAFLMDKKTPAAVVKGLKDTMKALKIDPLDAGQWKIFEEALRGASGPVEMYEAFVRGAGLVFTDSGALKLLEASGGKGFRLSEEQRKAYRAFQDALGPSLTARLEPTPAQLAMQKKMLLEGPGKWSQKDLELCMAIGACLSQKTAAEVKAIAKSAEAKTAVALADARKEAPPVVDRKVASVASGEREALEAAMKKVPGSSSELIQQGLARFDTMMPEIKQAVLGGYQEAAKIGGKDRREALRKGFHKYLEKNMGDEFREDDVAFFLDCLMV